jgi:glycosyltransferase involved in cell wall biosynthesis
MGTSGSAGSGRGGGHQAIDGRLRVAIATQYPGDPERPRGGVEAVSVSLVRSLARLEDLDVEVVTVDPEARAPSRQLVDGVTIHRLPRRARRLLVDAAGPGGRQLRSCLTTLRPHVVHSHDIYGMMVGSLAVPRVFTVHGFIHADTLVSGERFARARSWVWRMLETRSWARHGHIVAISPYVRERLSGRVRGRIHDIENPIAERFFALPRQEQPGTIFSAASIERRKNTLALVECAARLRAMGVDARLRLAGAVREPDYGRMVAERIAAAGLSDRVELLGTLPSAAVMEELSRASAFVLVSLEENAPMGIAEAMAVGLPIVASDRCGMPYMVRDGVSGYLVDPLDVREVADRLAKLLHDPSLRHRMGGVGQAFARERFHPDVVAGRTREVYRRAAGLGYTDPGER